MGYKKTEAIRLMLNDYEENGDKITDRYVAKIHQRFLQLMVDFYKNTPSIEMLPHAKEVFLYLKERGIKIGLTTGFSKEITDVIVERLGWSDTELVDYIVSSSEVPKGRPHPYMIQTIMRQTNVDDVARVIKVGDTEVDVHEGKNAGCLYSIGITTGAFSREELEPHHPSFIIDSLKELVPIIEMN